jgi:hypothetical protein
MNIRTYKSGQICNDEKLSDDSREINVYSGSIEDLTEIALQCYDYKII